MSQSHPQAISGAIHMVLPASPDFLTSLRVMARTAAALSDLSIDDIEEMQMAVDEAATLLLPLALDGNQELTATFTVRPAFMQASLSIPCVPGTSVDKQGLGWLMLTGLDPDVGIDEGGTMVSIRVSRRSGEA